MEIRKKTLTYSIVFALFFPVTNNPHIYEEYFICGEQRSASGDMKATQTALEQLDNPSPDTVDHLAYLTAGRNSW